MRFSCVCAMAILLTATRMATADATLDQQNDLTMAGSADSTSGGYSENAQTFTVGITGTLNRIEVQVVRFFGTVGDIIVSVYNTDTNGDFPLDTALASRSLPWTSIPTTGYVYQIFDFSSSAIPLTAGTKMAFGVSSTPNGASGGSWSSINVSTYAGGEAKFRVVNPNGPWQSFFFTHDYGFKTYVDAAAGTPGDFNNDDAVDARDFVVWRQHEGDPTEAALGGNGDNAGGVDEGDYTLWRSHYEPNASGAAFSAAVPEPGAMVLLIAGAECILTATRHRAHVRRC
jgi:hypothetical protein